MASFDQDLRFKGHTVSNEWGIDTNGDGKTRLRLAVDDRIQTVACKWCENLGFFERRSNRFVCVNIIDTTPGATRKLAINVGSFAKRFNLSRSQAKKLLQNADTFNQLPGLAEAASKTGVTNVPTLINNIFKRLSELLAVGKNADSGSFNHELKLFMEGEKPILVGTKLGEGGFGEVCVASDLSSPSNRSEVFKRAKLSDDSSVRHEYDVLTRLHETRGRERPGLQLPPRAFVNITRVGGGNDDLTDKRPGYLAQRYAGALDTKTFSSPKEIRSALAHLSDGVKYLHERGMYHGDIKPQNMLHMPGRYDLADLGGAQDKDSIRKRLDEYFASDAKSEALNLAYAIWGVYTNSFINTDDETALKDIIQSTDTKYQLATNDLEKEKILNEAQEQIFSLMMARDAHALNESFTRLLQVSPPNALSDQPEINMCIMAMRLPGVNQRLGAMRRLHELLHPSKVS